MSWVEVERQSVRILVFGYDFPHLKTVNGLYRIAPWPSTEITVWLAPKVYLEHYATTTPSFPQRSMPEHPSEVCSILGAECVVGPHSLTTWETVFAGSTFDLGIILGARILARELLEVVSVPVINFHPGVLPENRGLYNLHWAILNKLPQGVTTHLISPEVDRGVFLQGDIIPVYSQDTLVDIGFRLANEEMSQLTRVMDLLFGSGHLVTRGELGEGNYNSHLNRNLEIQANDLLHEYARGYEEYESRFLASSELPYQASIRS